MRELQGIDVRVASELRSQIRQKFNESKADKNRASVVAKLTEAQRELQFVRQYVGTARWKVSGIPTGGTMFGSGATSLGASSATSSTGTGHNHSHGDCSAEGHSHGPATGAVDGSWIGTGHAGDVKGRIGDVWPWQSSTAPPAPGQEPAQPPVSNQDQWAYQPPRTPLRIPKR